MTDSDLISVGEAAKLAGTSPHTLRQLVRTGAIPTYIRPLDRRTRLVRVADVTALTEPQRSTPTKELAPMTAA